MVTKKTGKRTARPPTSEASSWIARYWSTDSRPLIGGIKISRSSRFGLRSDAIARLESACGLNGAHCQGDVVPSALYPEIFPHCPGSWAQAIGGHCFGCRKKLTVKDAREWAAARKGK